MNTPLLSLAALTLLSLPLLSQVYTPPTPSKNQPSTPSDNITRAPTPQPTNHHPNNNSLLGNEIGFFNPTNDTISWNGSTWAASNNRLVAARFEKYLNEPENLTAAAQSYRQTIDQILSYLSPHRKGGPVFAEAVALLPKAAQYPGDAKLCDSLSNAIYTAILSQRDANKTKAIMAAMEREKKKNILDADWKARSEKDPNIGKSNTGAGKGNSEETTQQSTQIGRGAQSLVYAEHLRRIAEIEATKKTRETESKVKRELSKVQYQALMVQLFAQRRFEHVIMASRFYNMIWKEGDGTLYLDEDSDINKIFSESLGVNPTVSTLDSLANEAIRDVNKGVEVFSFLVQREELESASKRLSESFIIGEFMPSINTLARAKKRKVLEFVRGSNILLNAIDAKDYLRASQQIKELKNKAKDFDATKAEAAVATFTRASDMHLMMAKRHLDARDMDKAQLEIRQAMEIWPQNPKLAEVDQIINSGSSIIKLRNDFDRLFAEKNYREVFKRQHELSVAINHDPERLASFRQVLENITAIETAIGGATKMSNIGQDYAAWEELSEVHTRFPDDPDLNQVMTSLAPKVADFTIALSKAAKHEEQGNLGSALSWYYKAQHLHQGSKKADEAIERLVNRALKSNTL